MGGISMAVKFRHKETGLFFCRAKGLSPSRRDYDKLGEEGIFRKRLCLSEEESTKAQLKIRNGIGLVRNMQMNLK
jgi:hypothetical protein